MSVAPPQRLLAALEREAHLWLTPLAAAAGDAPAAAWQALLSADEVAAWRRFRVERPRLQFLAGRALARTTLSRYAAVAPAAWEFARGPHGRPEIAGPPGLPPLRFNLSHTDGWVACVVTLGHDAGVDVEWLRQVRDPVALARHSFAAAEAAAVESRSGVERRRRFFAYWTLKEAYVKARGEGVFTLGTRRFRFDLEGPGAIAVDFDAELGERPEGWQFALAELPPEHRLAVAIRRHGGDLRLVSRRVVPCCSEPEPWLLDLVAVSPPVAAARRAGRPG